MTVDHLKMLHTAGGKGIPSPVLLGLCRGLRGGSSKRSLGLAQSLPALLWGWGESSVWLAASAPSTAHGWVLEQ